MYLKAVVRAQDICGANLVMEYCCVVLRYDGPIRWMPQCQIEAEAVAQLVAKAGARCNEIPLDCDWTIPSQHIAWEAWIQISSFLEDGAAQRHSGAQSGCMPAST